MQSAASHLHLHEEVGDGAALASLSAFRRRCEVGRPRQRRVRRRLRLVRRSRLPRHQSARERLGVAARLRRVYPIVQSERLLLHRAEARPKPGRHEARRRCPLALCMKTVPAAIGKTRRDTK